MIETRDGITWTQRTAEPVRLWDEPGPEDLEGEHRRQRLTAAVVGALLVAVLAFVVASALVERRFEALPCGVPVSQGDAVIVRVCDGRQP